MPNLFHRAEEQDNQDELYLVYFFHKWSGQWMSLCPYNANTKMASAMAIPEDPTAPNDFYLRVHGDRRRVEVRAQLGLQPVGDDQRVAIQRRRTGP